MTRQRPRKRYIGVRLAEPDYKRIARLARKAGVSLAEMIREIVVAFRPGKV